MAVSMSMTAFAGQWQQDAKGWWYQNDDKTYLKDGWKWVDGKCYYFTSDGYCLTGTQTPDGYTVDASGAWIVDGVVQTQGGEAAAAPRAEYRHGRWFNACHSQRIFKVFRGGWICLSCQLRYHRDDCSGFRKPG